MSNINIFINSNSSAGFVSYYDSNTAGLEHAISLSSYPSVAAEDIIKSVIANAPDAEIIHNCIDNRIEGVILPGQSASVINIPAYCTQSRLISIPENLAGFKECKNHLTEAHKEFAEALKVHDSWEKIYLDNINFDALDALELRLENIIFDGEPLGKTPSVRDRFFGAATADGSKDYVECVKTIARASDELFAVDGFAPNAVPAQEIEDIAGFYTNAHTSGSLDEAIRSAKAAAAGSGGIVVVCGSLYLASEYLNMAGSSSNCAD